MVASCFVWEIYGILKREPMIWGTNIVELTLSLYFFVEFTNYAPKHSPTFPGSVYHHIKFCVGTVVAAIWIALFFSNALHIIGDLTVILTVLTFASPLAAVKAVLESQSSESIPWPFTLAAMFNCSLWCIVGLLEMHDYYVYFPAIMGLIFSSVQIALKLYFGDNNDQSNPSYTRAPVEMPYPVLGSVRQVVMWGSNNSNSNAGHYYNNLPQDLHFESNMSNTDYVELGVPLANSCGDMMPPTPSPLPPQPMDFATQQQFYANHHKRNKSNEGLEYSTVDGLQSIVFEDDNTSTPPPGSSLRDSFRSRSGGSGPGHTHGF
jgi:uncharacterized protein with PQ loop repeat